MGLTGALYAEGEAAEHSLLRPRREGGRESRRCPVAAQGSSNLGKIEVGQKAVTTKGM